MDPTVWGPKLWFMIHTIAINYPDNPTYQDKRSHEEFYNSLKYVIPCEKCRVHYTQRLKRMPIINHLDNKPTLEFLLESYAEIVYKKLLICEITSKLKLVRAVANNSKWMIISGGKEEELRLLFNERNIGHYFNGGIFGSPTDKLSIFQREIKTKNIEFPALFLGDSEYDFVVSKEIGVDFIFVSDWSEFKDINSYSSKHKIKSIGKVSDILKLNNE